MGRAQDYLWQIALTLERCQLAPQVTEEMIQQGCKRLREERWVTTIGGAFIVLEAWLPDRCVKFDSELDNCQEAAHILRAYAQATGGEWNPADIASTLLSVRGEVCTAAIDFLFQGVPFHWQYTIYPGEAHSDWLRSFYEQLVQFFETSLQGTFWGPFLGDQTVFDCYLPRQAAADLTAIQEAMEMDFGPEVDFQIDEGFRAFVNAL